MGKILRGPWPEQRSAKNISPDLAGPVPILPIIEVSQELQQAGRIFKTHSDILPVDCKNILKVLGRLDELVTVACDSLQQANSLTIVLSSARYPLLTTLFTLQEQTSQLMDRLDAYRSTCLKPSRRLYQQRHEIVKLLERIAQHSSEFPDLMQSLDADAEVQRQRLSEMKPASSTTTRKLRLKVPTQSERSQKD